MATRARPKINASSDPPSWEVAEAALCERDHDPAYADAPVLDAYARVSVNPDTGDLEKTDRQLSDILGNIAGRHARLGQVHRDDNVSAYKARRSTTAWARLVIRLEARQAAGVVAWHTDRLLRQPRDLERLVDFGDRGLLVASCFGDYKLDSADDRFTLRVLTAAAAKESDNISRRQIRKHAALRGAGYSNGGTRPFGFQGRATQIAPEEQIALERDAIAWGVEAMLSGVSMRAICTEWNARGLRPTQRIRAWHPDSLRRVLDRARNAGLIEYQGQIVGVLRDVEPIISRDDFEAVRAMVVSRKRGRPPGPKHMLSGIMRCALCGAAMSGKTEANITYADGQPRRIYRCSPDRGCTKVSIDGRRADQWARDLVLAVLSDPKHAQAVARSSAALAKVSDAIESVHATQRGIAARLGDGRMSLDAHDAAADPLARRLTALEAERDALLATGAGSTPTTRARADLEAEWDAASTETRRALVAQAAPRGISCAPTIKRGPASNPADRLAVIRQ